MTNSVFDFCFYRNATQQKKKYSCTSQIIKERYNHGSVSICMTTNSKKNRDDIRLRVTLFLTNLRIRVDSNHVVRICLWLPLIEPLTCDNPEAIDENQTNVTLRKRLNAFSGTMFIVNYMVGSGIFVTPHLVIIEAGSYGATLIVWIVCSIVIMCGCLINVELGCMLPLAGGTYEHMLVGLHRIAAYLFSWTYLILISPGACAVGSLSFSSYILAIFFPCGAPLVLRRILAFCCIWLFVIMNALNIELVNLCHKIFAAGKLITLFAIIVMGMHGLDTGGASNFKNFFANTTSEPLKFSLAFHSVIFTFSGWNGLNFLAEELQNPARSLPIASILGLTIVSFCFLWVNISYMFILTTEEMQTVSTTAVAFASKVWQPLGIVFSILVSLSMLGYINSELNATSRILYGASRRGHLPCPFRLLTVSQSSPAAALLTIGVLASIYLAIDELNILVYMVSFSEVTFYIILAATFLLLRLKHPNIKRPFRANIGFAVAFALVMVFILIISLAASPHSCAVAAALILAGIFFYPLAIYKKHIWFVMLYDRFTMILQKSLLSVPSSPSEDLSKYILDTINST
ncbi:hypothetical protein GJ496_003786 [Pomphorhynchus laevis]|nr:hypothetical protein GJ496_003786 [Pomphorhynchus laevis]